MLYLFLLLLLPGCDKVKKTRKKLAGTWQIIEYKYSNSSGLSYYYPAEGTFEFDNCGEHLCSFKIDMTYFIDTIAFDKNMSGLYTFKDEKAEYYKLIDIDTTGIKDTVENARILLITKTDLKTEFSDSEGRHLFILEK